MITGPWLARRARKLIADVRQPDGRQQQVTLLTDLARHDPRTVAELAVELAGHVTDDVLGRIIGKQEPTAEELLGIVAREAHRLHWHGDRTHWVLWGERTYQRLKKTRHRRQKTA